MADLDSLEGLEEFKKEMHRVVNLKLALEYRVGDVHSSDLFPAAYIFTTEHDGAGITTALGITALVLFHVGICKEPAFQEVACLRMFFHGLRKSSGLVALKVIGQPPGKLLLEALDDHEEISGCPFPVVIAKAGDSGSVLSVQQALDSRGLAFRMIHFPD